MMRFGTLVATAALAVGTVVVAQDVTYDFDKTARFAAYRTYAWVRGTELDGFNHARIVGAIETQLAAKGLSNVGADANPDVYVAYHAIVERERQLTASGTGGYPFALRSGTARLEDILTGTLALDVIDAQTKTIVWRGIATKELDTDLTRASWARRSA